ncbi:MAG: hypothetical protein VYB06_01115, partial [Cyanobacteriota bacterium]|nr:hypothetical protein [Cyanobacteriota bacterium]
LLSVSALALGALVSVAARSLSAVKSRFLLTVGVGVAFAFFALGLDAFVAELTGLAAVLALGAVVFTFLALALTVPLATLALAVFAEACGLAFAAAAWVAAGLMAGEGNERGKWE